MDALGRELLVDFATILTPFVLMSSCAALVWSLQARYGRVVQSLRSLAFEWRATGDDREREVLRCQIDILKKRARWLRNGVVGHYLAMGCFLVTSILLAFSVYTGWPLAPVVAFCFFAGLALICWTMANSFFDTMKSFDAVGEELKSRVLARVIHVGHSG